MKSEMRQELLRVLGELSEECPDVRLGQLITQLATLAKGPTVEAIWDAEARAERTMATLPLSSGVPPRHNDLNTRHEGAPGMSNLITEIVGGERYQYYPLGDYVVRAVGVCGGRPTFKYTRIEITGVFERLADGEPMDELIAGYRGRVSQAAITEAVQLVTAEFLKTLPQLESA